MISFLQNKKRYHRSEVKRWNIFIWKHYLIKEKRFKDGIILKKID